MRSTLFLKELLRNRQRHSELQGRIVTRQTPGNWRRAQAPSLFEAYMTPEVWLQTAIFAVVLLGILWRLAVMATKFETIGIQQASEISQLKDEVKEVAKVVTALAVQSTRLDTMGSRLAMQEKLIDDLRRGEGFIKFPQSR